MLYHRLDLLLIPFLAYLFHLDAISPVFGIDILLTGQINVYTIPLFASTLDSHHKIQ